MNRLTHLQLRGFKSIENLTGLDFRSLNVIIGANGAGKSNLVAFFRMLSWMSASPGNLQFHLSRSGGANSLLHDGAARTPQMEASLAIKTDAGRNDYSMRLFHAAPDTLIFADERYRFSRASYATEAPWISLGSGHRESRLLAEADTHPTARVILQLLRDLKVHQFHNTSETARMKTRWSVDDSRYLKEDGANLAPFLYRLREFQSPYYTRIVETIRQAAPFFGDFTLQPQNGTILLQWSEIGSDLVFGPHQASDGSLRLFALISLLLQPEHELPDVIILDEPELGLHPYGIGLLAGALRAISNHCQVLVCTQSIPLINQFEPDDIIVVDRPDRGSTFTRLDTQKLEHWLEEYSLAELWEKNVIGGRP
jgi:predicted ATPase